MARTKISEFSATAADNTDIDSIDIAEGCAPSGINNAIRELMAQLKDFQTGAAGDPFNGAVNGTVGATTPAAGTFTNLAYTGTLTGGTGVINIGSGQVYKDASGFVGLGTSSPGNKLHVSGAVAVAGAVNSFNVDGLVLDYGSSVSRLVAARTGGNYSQMSFYTAGANSSGVVAERMRIDTSGNLGLGVTPSAWAIGAAIQVKSGGFYSGGSEAGVSQNAYYASGWKYIGTGAATRYETFSGAHAWYTAPSGTAGNAISFTQAMTLDSSGNLLVGITTNSSGSRLRVRSSGNTFSTNCIIFENSSATNVGYIRDDGAWNSGVGTGSPYNLTTGSAANLFVASDGFLYRSTSSLKYKTDVQDSTRGLADVMNLRPVTYKGKNDGDTVFGGLIAEEVHEAGLTEFVQYAEDGSPDALAYGNMVSLLVKAIQELKAEFDAYKAAHP